MIIHASYHLSVSTLYFSESKEVGVLRVVVEMLHSVFQNRPQLWAIHRDRVHTPQTVVLVCHYGTLTRSNIADLGGYGEFIISSLLQSCCAFTSSGFLSVLEVAVLPGEATLNRAVSLLDLILEGIKCFRAILGKAKVTL